MSKFSATIGVEEEVFILEKGRMTPTLQSLDYLRKLYWSNPKKYMKYTASNFSKGEDRKQCFMGSVEIATGKHDSPDELIQDLKERRTAFAKAAQFAIVVPVGALFSISSPTNTASSHVHIGVPRNERERVYSNLCYFAPVLAVAAANSPWAEGKPFGISYRMAQKGLLGPLREDIEYRFQDVIVSKRLGTIEMRIFDPIPELDRLYAILDAVKKIAELETRFPFSRDRYNEERKRWTVEGKTEFVESLTTEMKEAINVPFDWIEKPLGLHLGEFARQHGIRRAYEEADRIWREPTQTVAKPRPFSVVRTASGIAGYYAVRLPFMAYKGYREWYGKP